EWPNTKASAPFLPPPPEAHIPTYIESRPVICDRQHARGRRLVNRPRHVRGMRGPAESGRAHESDKQTTHRALLHFVLQLESSCPAGPHEAGWVVAAQDRIAARTEQIMEGSAVANVRENCGFSVTNSSGG